MWVDIQWPHFTEHKTEAQNHMSYTGLMVKVRTPALQSNRFPSSLGCQLLSPPSSDLGRGGEHWMSTHRGLKLHGVTWMK